MNSSSGDYAETYHPEEQQGEVVEQLPDISKVATVDELLQKEADRRRDGETLVITSPVYVEDEGVSSTTPPAPPVEKKSEAEQAEKEEEDKNKEPKVKPKEDVKSKEEPGQRKNQRGTV